jgi:hypothetical protein
MRCCKLDPGLRQGDSEIADRNKTDGNDIAVLRPLRWLLAQSFAI